MPSSRAERGEIVAVVELGTNAVRSMLARVKRGVGFTVLDEARAPTRLGSVERRMSRAAICATLDAVDAFVHEIASRHPRLIVVATAAVREARNAATLLAAFRQRHGVEVQILSGEEEARLAALEAMFSLPVKCGRVVDLGGGSLQVARIDDRRARVIGSVPLGVLKTTRRFLGGARATASQVAALRHAVRAHAGPLLFDAGPSPLIALGGSVRALARMHGAGERRRRPVHGYRLHLDDVAALRARLERLPVRRRGDVPGLKAERADTILAGAVIVEEILALTRQTTLTVCGRGVRHGVLIRETFDRGVPA